jgi:short-subunit dehydrogenase
VARDQGHLDAMTGELTAGGVEAAGFSADLTDRAAALAVTDAIEARLGPIDVLEYSPAGGPGMRTSPSGIDVRTVTPCSTARC